MKPFFSIIIPCCDVEAYIRECLDSVLKQPFQDWECLAGVETSKDRTEEIVREYAARDSRIRLFTGPRSGSCSATRNTGTEMAQGDYVIFLDGDDTIADGALENLFRKISRRPGADLYPCVILAHNEMTGERETRDNYPADSPEELTGPEATILLERVKLNPSPMLQFTVFRREFLMEEHLRCIYGLRHQDSEFSPRALYLAKRVVPLHEPYYCYRIRENSVQTKAKGKGYFLKDFAIGLKSLFAFHAQVSQRPDFDRRAAESWARAWSTTLFIKWFSRDFVRMVPRRDRLETLKIIFGDGFHDFDLLMRAGSFSRRAAAWWVRFFVRHPWAGRLSEWFFVHVYFPMLDLKKGK